MATHRQIYREWRRGQYAATCMLVAQLAAYLPDVALNVIDAVLAKVSKSGHADADKLAEISSSRTLR